MRVKLFLSHCLFLAAISFDWKKYERRLKSIHISIKSKFLNHIHLQFCLKCPLSLVETVNRTNWRRQNEQQGQNVLIKIACPNLLVSKCWLFCNIDFTTCFMVRLSLSAVSGTVLCTLQKEYNQSYVKDVSFPVVVVVVIVVVFFPRFYQSLPWQVIPL